MLVSMPVETFRLGGGIPRPSTGIKTQALPTLRGSTENELRAAKMIQQPFSTLQ